MKIKRKKLTAVIATVCGMAMVAPASAQQRAEFNAAKEVTDSIRNAGSQVVDRVQQGVRNTAGTVRNGVNGQPVRRAGQAVVNGARGVLGGQGQTAPGQTAPGQANQGQYVQGQNVQGQTYAGQPQGQVIQSQQGTPLYDQNGNQLFDQNGQPIYANTSGLQGQGQQSTQNQYSQNQSQPAGNQSFNNDQQATQQNGPTLVSVLVEKMKSSQQDEIELAKMAKQKSDNQQVTEYADMLISDHQSFLQDIEKLEMKVQSDQSSNQARVPQEMISLASAAEKKVMQATREMLQQPQGQDFAMAYLGVQIVCHTQEISHLQAIAEQGPQQLREVARKAAEKQQQHLNRAKEIAKQLENDARNNQNS